MAAVVVWGGFTRGVVSDMGASSFAGDELLDCEE